MPQLLAIAIDASLGVRYVMLPLCGFYLVGAGALAWLDLKKGAQDIAAALQLRKRAGDATCDYISRVANPSGVIPSAV